MRLAPKLIQPPRPGSRRIVAARSRGSLWSEVGAIFAPLLILRCSLNSLAPQTHDHIDTGDFVTLRWRWNSTYRYISLRDVHQLVPIFQKKVLMFRVVGVEIQL
jgi:hypothetical protein